MFRDSPCSLVIRDGRAEQRLGLASSADLCQNEAETLRGSDANLIVRRRIRIEDFAAGSDRAFEVAR